MKNILQEKERVEGLMTSLDKEPFAGLHASYSDLGSAMAILLSVSRAALWHIEDNPSCSQEVSPLDVVRCLDMVSKMIPWSELELMDYLKDEVK